MHAEPAVTSLQKHKHTQVNYYPYTSVITAHRNTSWSPTATSAEDAFRDKEGAERK